MADTKHYRILESESLINEEQLEELLQESWILLQIVEKSGKYFYYFYRN